jgi:Tfp pilus assembly protein PilV
VVRPASGRGFALVDAIVAAVLLGAALAVTIGLSGQAISSQARGRDLRIAAMLADEQLNLVLARGPDDYASRFPVEGPCDPPLERFRYRLDFVSGSSADAYLVRATISWYSGLTPDSLTVETLIAPRRGDDPDPDRRPEAPPERLQ